MKLVVDEYPENCETCIFKTDDFSRRQNFCNILHTHIGGVNDVRFDHKCYEHFILFKDLTKMLNEKDEEETPDNNKTEERYSPLLESIRNAKNTVKAIEPVSKTEHDFMMSEAFGGLV